MDRSFTSDQDPASAPWMQNAYWASGVLRNKAAENLLILYIISMGWSIVTFTVVGPVISEVAKNHDFKRLVFLILPAIGVGLLAYAVRRTLQITKFGASVLNLQTLPATPGGDLIGTIHVARHFEPEAATHLRLVCINRTPAAGGGNTQFREKLLWESEQSIDQLPLSRNGTDIPVLFHLPPDARTSSDENFRDQIIWRMEASCKVDGVDYLSRYEIPVFDIKAPEVSPPEQAPAEEPVFHGSLRDGELDEPGIFCKHTADGGWQIHFGPGRNKSSAMTTSVIGLGLSAAGIGLILLPFGSLLRVVTVVMGCVALFVGGTFVYIAFFLWFVSTDITVSRGLLVLERGIPLYRCRQTFQASDISEVIYKVDGRSQIGDGAANTFYGIQLKTRDGKTVWIANNISEKENAVWLAGGIKTAIGS
jgi:hypothetical protein